MWQLNPITCQLQLYSAMLSCKVPPVGTTGVASMRWASKANTSVSVKILLPQKRNYTVRPPPRWYFTYVNITAELLVTCTLHVIWYLLGILTDYM